MGANESCEIRLDRLGFSGACIDSKLPPIDGFRIEKDFKPHQRGSFSAYERVCRYLSRTNSAQIILQHKPRCPWVAASKVTMIAHDQTGLTAEEVESAILQFANHRVTLVELAVDFLPNTGIDADFVRKYGRFGKSRCYRGKKGQLTFGSRLSPKFVRFYPKTKIDRYRVEVEAHGALIRKYSITSVRDVGVLAANLVPCHFCFAAIRWKKLRKYLVRRFGEAKGEDILSQARSYGETSVRKVLRFLSRNDVANPHRFVRPLGINDDAQSALRGWAEDWNNRMQIDA